MLGGRGEINATSPNHASGLVFFTIKNLGCHFIIFSCAGLVLFFKPEEIIPSKSLFLLLL